VKPNCQTNQIRIELKRTRSRPRWI